MGPYRIVAAIGAGGMGEVFRARDERLERDAAIKVLPRAFAEDPGRLRRFADEARAAGGLTHPGILAVHDLGEHEGVPYLVTELLEGQTLRERLASGQLPPRKAIDLTAQTAHALAAAHDKGIIHRDLKPENLFVLKDGRVKILDFGLAKALAREGEGEEAVDAVGATAVASTQSGAVVGTPGYMAPEMPGLEPWRTSVMSFTPDGAAAWTVRRLADDSVTVERLDLRTGKLTSAADVQAALRNRSATFVALSRDGRRGVAVVSEPSSELYLVSGLR